MIINHQSGHSDAPSQYRRRHAVKPLRAAFRKSQRLSAIARALRPLPSSKGWMVTNHRCAMAAFNFVNLIINIQRSVVDQNVGKCKTEASQKPVPIDEYTAKDLLAWYRLTPCRGPDDWVFATEAIVPERNVASYTARLVKAGH